MIVLKQSKTRSDKNKLKLINSIEMKYFHYYSFTKLCNMNIKQYRFLPNLEVTDENKTK